MQKKNYSIYRYYMLMNFSSFPTSFVDKLRVILHVTTIFVLKGERRLKKTVIGMQL